MLGRIHLIVALFLILTLEGTRSGPVFKTRIESVRINGTSYVAVVGLKLPFLKAEEYCANEFHSSMHLASITSEEEWQLMRENFEALLGEEIWLGGIVSKNSRDEVELNWLDRSGVHYHNLTNDQLTFLSKEITESDPKPLVGSLLTGMWSVELLDQHENLVNAFICKEFRKSNYNFRKFMLDMMKPFWQNQDSLFDSLFHNHRHPRYHWRRPAGINLGPLRKSTKKREDSKAVNLGELVSTTLPPKTSIKNIVPKDI